MTLRLVVTVGLVAVAVETGSAQWINYPDPGIPRTADGKPNLTAPAPRFPDGRIDLSGVWQPDPKATVGAPPVGQTLGEDPVIRLRTADGSPYPLLPAAEAEYKRRLESSFVLRDHKKLRRAPSLLLSERMQQRYPRILCDIAEAMFTVENPKPKPGGARAAWRELRRSDIRLREVARDAWTALRTYG